MISKLLILLQISLLTVWLPNPLIYSMEIRFTPIFDSLALLEELLKTQVIVRNHISTFRSHLGNDRIKGRLFDGFIERCVREEMIAANMGADKYLENPINAFTLITRLSRDYANVEAFFDDIDYERKMAVYPFQDDLTGAVEELTRLQLLYDLDPYLLANGTLVNPFSNKTNPVLDQVSPMTPDDCYELSLVEYEKKDRTRNIAWLGAALKLLKSPRDEMVFSRADVLERMSAEYYNIGDLLKTEYYLGESIKAGPFRPENRDKVRVLEKLKRQIAKRQCGDDTMFNFNVPPSRNEEGKPKMQDGAYPGLCVRPSKAFINPRLKCYLTRGPHGFLKLAPLKTEKLSRSPFIVMYHDVISDSEIHELKSLARALLHPAPSLETDKDNDKDITYCRHQLAWISDEMSGVVARLTRKVSRITSLNVNSNTSEDYQVANYGIGGYYGPHYDFIKPENSSTKIEKTYATILFYLTDIKEGGATIFTQLDLTVYPRRKSALVWLSLDKSGSDDWRTQHAACPALHGNRWVASKWIAQSGQELIRPCPSGLKYKKKSRVARRKVRLLH